MNDIRDIKGLEHFSYSILYYVIPILAVLALMYLGWYFYKKRLAKIRVDTVPPPPPDEVALRELKKLRDGVFEKYGEKFFSFRLSEIFRGYLEARLHFQASDMTTEEILLLLPAKGVLSAGQVAHIGRILIETDRVKFAKYRPGRDIAFAMLNEVEKFVIETREKGEEVTAK